MVAAPTLVPVTVTIEPKNALAGVKVIDPGARSVVPTVKVGVVKKVPRLLFSLIVELKVEVELGIFKRICVLESNSNGIEIPFVEYETDVIEPKLVPVTMIALPPEPDVALNGLLANVGLV